MMSLVDVLIPTYNRPAALAVTLTSLVSQTLSNFQVIIADQTEEYNVCETSAVIDSYGGCGLIPSGIYHMHLPTNIPDRPVDAPRYLEIEGKYYE